MTDDEDSSEYVNMVVTMEKIMESFHDVQPKVAISALVSMAVQIAMSSRPDSVDTAELEEMMCAHMRLVFKVHRAIEARKSVTLN